MNTIEHLFINLSYVSQEQAFETYFSYVKKEFLQLRNDYHLAVKTIYLATSDSIFLTNKQLKTILSLIESIVNDHLIEYSFEIGYQTLTKKQLKILKNFGVNRLVWKIRTFNQKLLKSINPNFKIKGMLSLIKTSFKCGFTNFSFDLEDNIDRQRQKDLLNDLKIALSGNPSHISYQSHTNYINLDNKKLITKYLRAYNYDNYEFFSFALSKSYYSQQTLAYLQLKNWYGLGPNAASFISGQDKIITINNTNDDNWEQESINLEQNEYYQLLLTQGLMLRSGLVLEDDQLLAYQNFLTPINELIKDDKLVIKDNTLQTTTKGWALLNDVLFAIINT